MQPVKGLRHVVEILRLIGLARKLLPKLIGAVIDVVFPPQPEPGLEEGESWIVVVAIGNRRHELLVERS